MFGTHSLEAVHLEDTGVGGFIKFNQVATYVDASHQEVASTKSDTMVQPGLSTL